MHVQSPVEDTFPLDKTRSGDGGGLLADGCLELIKDLQITSAFSLQDNSRWCCMRLSKLHNRLESRAFGVDDTK